MDDSDYLPAEAVQLTDAVISNLTSLALTNISLFNFGDTISSQTKRNDAAQCKTFPGDAAWPIDLIWDIFDLLTGGALIKTIPLASPCYDNWGNYDAEECAYVTEQWTVSTIQYVVLFTHTTAMFKLTETSVDHPTSVMSPLFQGLTCIPSSLSGTCTLGGYPSYAVNVSNVSPSQLAQHASPAFPDFLVITGC